MYPAARRLQNLREPEQIRGSQFARLSDIGDRGQNSLLKRFCG